MAKVKTAKAAKKTAKPKAKVKTPDKKRCFRCKKTKKAAEFSSNSSKPDGLATMCKKCYSEYQAGYRAKKNGTKAKAAKAKAKTAKVKTAKRKAA